MNKTIIIIIFCGLMPVFQSCHDSLGIDPSVQIIPTHTDDEIGDSSPGMFRADTILFKELSEKFILYNSSDLGLWNDDYKFTWDIFLDTTKPQFKLWMTLNMSGPVIKPETTKRHDWVGSYKLKFKTILEENHEYILDSAQGNWNSLSLEIDTVINGSVKLRNYSGTQITSRINFESIDRVNGMIQGHLFIDLMPVNTLETKSFSCSFYIRYKKL